MSLKTYWEQNGDTCKFITSMYYKDNIESWLLKKIRCNRNSF